MRAEQTVKEMAEEVLGRQARALVDRTGQPFENALEAVSETHAGRQLRELADSKHHDQKAGEWQSSLPWKRAEEYHYTRGLRATWSGWKARRRAPSTTRSWRRNSLA